MIYVVSGFMRTGTSCLMQACIAGGMTPAYSPLGERLNDNGNPHYKPNRNGFFELELAEYGTPGWPLQYQDRLIKVISYQRDNVFIGCQQMEVNPTGYRIVWMLRNAEEIRQSWEAAEIGPPLRPEVVADIARQQDVCFRLAANRIDVESVLPVWYRDVVENPLLTFELMKGLGWPIDPVKAAGAVDPSQYRFRIENLTPGI